MTTSSTPFPGRPQRPDLDRSVAEQLLSGQHTADPVLGPVLQAAAQPESPADLSAGAARALAAFQQAVDVVPMPSTSRSPNATESSLRRKVAMIRRSLAAAVTAKTVAVAAVVATATGGVAFAAGILPSGSPSRPPSHSATPDSGASSQAPRPNVRGLCTAFAAGAFDGPGNSDESPAFQALVTAAGGVDQVSSFCAALLPSADPSSPSGAPSEDSAHPGGKPTAHPVHPSHPVKPEHPKHPDHPAHPNHAANPGGPSGSDHPALEEHPGRGSDNRPSHAGGGQQSGGGQPGGGRRAP